MVFLSSSEYWFFNRATSSLWALSILSLGTWIIIWNKILQNSNNCHYSSFTWGQWWLKEVLAMASYIWDTLYLCAPTSLPSTADRWYDHTAVCRGRLECSCKQDTAEDCVIIMNVMGYDVPKLLIILPQLKELLMGWTLLMILKLKVSVSRE